jgi:hypothetical protein
LVSDNISYTHQKPILDQDKLGEDGINRLKEQLYCTKQLPIKPKIEQNNVSIVYSGQSAALSQPASQLVQLQYGQNIVVTQNMRVSPQKGKQRISQGRSLSIFFVLQCKIYTIKELKYNPKSNKIKLSSS